ncbi:MAG: cobalt ECF transporter T component CbiQ [Treponema sp.]|nr:cobalt ECF transporter T component CbiQ [Treponema sp.]
MNLENAVHSLGTLESYALRDTIIHRRSAGAKLIAAFVFIVVTISFPNAKPGALAALFIFPFVLGALSETPPALIVTRLAPALPFVLLGAAGNMYALKTVVYAGTFEITQGMLCAVSILLKAILTVSAALILAATTPFVELISALGSFHVPNIFCLLLGLTYRYITVLSREASRILTAYRLRSSLRRPLLRHAGIFLGQFVLRSFDRAQRVYWAMKCRGFENGMRRISRPWNVGDLVFLGLQIGLLVSIRFFNVSAFVGSVWNIQ